MNPYRTSPPALRSRFSRALRTRTLARFAVILFGATAFATGYGLAPRAPEPQPIDLAGTCAAGCAAAASSAATSAAEETPAAKLCGTEEKEPPRRAYAIPSAQARATIAKRAREALQALGKRDLRALAALSDQTDGIELGVIGLAGTQLYPADLARCLDDPRERLWRGVDGTAPMKCGAVWKEHIFDADFARASQVDYNLPSLLDRPIEAIEADDDQSTDPMLRAFGEDIVVQIVVRRPTLDRLDDESDTKGWSTLRLAWRPIGEEWRLAGVYWSEWTTP